MKKALTVFILAVVLCVSLASCSAMKKNNPDFSGDVSSFLCVNFSDLA